MIAVSWRRENEEEQGRQWGGVAAWKCCGREIRSPRWPPTASSWFSPRPSPTASPRPSTYSTDCRDGLFHPRRGRSPGRPQPDQRDCRRRGSAANVALPPVGFAPVGHRGSGTCSRGRSPGKLAAIQPANSGVGRKAFVAEVCPLKRHQCSRACASTGNGAPRRANRPRTKTPPAQRLPRGLRGTATPFQKQEPDDEAPARSAVDERVTLTITRQ